MNWRSTVGAALLVMPGCADGTDSGRGRQYDPPAGLERLVAVALDGDDIGMVRDFDVAGDTVYLLDMTGRVVVIGLGGERPVLARHFGRRGSGPGELLQPTGLAVADGRVMVMDGTRLHFYEASGEPLMMKWVHLPCAMGTPSIAPASSGLFVYGNCLRGGYVTDTMHAVLAWAADTSTFDVVLEVPRFTRDGSMGSIFGAGSLLSGGPSGTHAFGGGETNCMWLIRDPATESGTPHATATCPAAAAAYSADPPASIKRRMRSASIPGFRFEWPDPLPTYVDRFVADDAIVLLRPYRADSLVLQTAATGADGHGVDLAIAPLDGLVGCKAAGCLWILDDRDTPRLIMLDRSRIAGMLQRARVQ